MDEEVKRKGLVFQTVIYFFLGLVMLPLAIGGLFSYPDIAWLFGLAFLFAALLFLYSAFANLKKSKEIDKQNAMRKLEMEAEAFRSREFSRQVQAQQFSNTTSTTASADITNTAGSHATTETPPTASILAHWTFAPGEWKKFQGVQKKIVTGDSVIQMLLITFGGAWIIHDDKGEDWTFSITFCFIFSLLFIFLKNYIKKGFTSVSGNGPVDVIIDTEKILLNGKLFSFNDSERWFEKISIEKKDGQTYLEVRYGWKTRSGNTNDEVRIPVPEGKMEEAERVVEKVRGRYG